MWLFRKPSAGHGREPRWLERGLPIFVPEGYEPRYPYPLVLVLHDSGATEREALPWIPRLSRRNYLGVGLRGTERALCAADGAIGYGWGEASPRLTRQVRQAASASADAAPDPFRRQRAAARLRRTVRLVREQFHVHTERIFLIGFGEGAAAALRFTLATPRAFGGVVAINGWLPQNGSPLASYPQTRSFPALLCRVSGLSAPAPEAHERMIRLLHAGGCQVGVHEVDGAEAEWPAAIDAWIQQQLAQGHAGRA